MAGGLDSARGGEDDDELLLPHTRHGAGSSCWTIMALSVRAVCGPTQPLEEPLCVPAHAPARDRSAAERLVVLTQSGGWGWHDARLCSPMIDDPHCTLDGAADDGLRKVSAAAAPACCSSVGAVACTTTHIHER